MTTDTLIRRFHDLAGLEPETALDADSLIGFFQIFRPDGSAIDGLYSDLDVGQALHARLDKLYAVAGNDRRPQGGRDAYFVIRNPEPLDPELARQLGFGWLQGLRELARCVGDAMTAEVLDPIPRFASWKACHRSTPRTRRRSRNC